MRSDDLKTAKTAKSNKKSETADIADKKLLNELTKDNQQLKEQLNQLEEQIKEQQIRHAADRDNANKRHTQQLAQTAKYASESFAKDILEIIDAMQMARKSVKSETQTELSEGLDMAISVMLKTLAKHGIVQIDTTGKFDPELHIAVKKEQSEDPANTIIQTLQQGYIMHDRVLRHASVIVAG